MRVCTSVCISMTYSFVDLSFVVDKERLVLINTVVCLALECILEVGGPGKVPNLSQKHAIVIRSGDLLKALPFGP